MQCCGTYGPNDWEAVYKNQTLPKSCCVEIPINEENKNQEKDCTVDHANKMGCLDKLLQLLDSKTLILAGVVLAVAGVQVCVMRIS